MIRLGVIGSGGYVGSWLVSAARALDYNVWRASSQDGTGLDPQSGRFDSNFSIPKGLDAIIYLSQSPFYKELGSTTEHLFQVNALSAFRAAVEAAKAGCPRFFYMSTGTVYAPSFLPMKETNPVRRDLPYALSKLHGEELTQLLNGTLEVITLRPFSIYGPNQRGKLIANLCNSISSGKPVFLDHGPEKTSSKGGLRISLLFIQDFVSIFLNLLSLKKLPATINIGGPDFSIEELAFKIGEIYRLPVKLQASLRQRDSDYISDSSSLCSITTVSWTPLDVGLKNVVDASGLANAAR